MEIKMDVGVLLGLVDAGGLIILAGILFNDKRVLQNRLIKVEDDYRDCLTGREEVWKEIAKLQLTVNGHSKLYKSDDDTGSYGGTD